MVLPGCTDAPVITMHSAPPIPAAAELALKLSLPTCVSQTVCCAVKIVATACECGGESTRLETFFTIQSDSLHPIITRSHLFQPHHKVQQPYNSVSFLLGGKLSCRTFPGIIAGVDYLCNDACCHTGAQSQAWTQQRKSHYCHPFSLPCCIRPVWPQLKLSPLPSVFLLISLQPFYV